MRTLFCIFMLVSGLLNAQKPKQYRYTVYVNYPAYSVRADVSAIPQKFRAIKECDYYWYYSNKIIHTQGGCDGKLLNGQFTSFYLSNNLKEKGCFKEGLRNGEFKSWFENGTISETANWKKGIKHGTFAAYNEKGELLSQANYRNGRLHGPQSSYENGAVKSRQQFKKGKEIVKAPKKEKKKKEEKIKREESTSGTTLQADQKKSPVKEKFKNIFRKKEKKGKDDPSGIQPVKERRKKAEKATPVIKEEKKKKEKVKKEKVKKEKSADEK